MKRVIVFLVLLGMFAALAVAGPAERFVKYDTFMKFGGTAGLWKPTFNGARFIPDKISIHMYTNGGAKSCKLTVYIPLDKGPVMATDSLLIILETGQNYTEPTIFDYYGPVSDTMRVGTEAGSWLRVHGYGG